MRCKHSYSVTRAAATQAAGRPPCTARGRATDPDRPLRRGQTQAGLRGRPSWWALVAPYLRPPARAAGLLGTQLGPDCPPHEAMGHSQCGPSRGHSGPECSGQSQPDMHWGHTWAGPAAPAALGELDVGSLAERATRPGPSRARTPWLGPAGDTRLAAGAGGWLGRGTATPSGAGRLGLSAATARQGTGRQGWPRATAASPRQGVAARSPEQGVWSGNSASRQVPHGAESWGPRDPHASVQEGHEGFPHQTWPRPGQPSGGLRGRTAGSQVLGEQRPVGPGRGDWMPSPQGPHVHCQAWEAAPHPPRTGRLCPDSHWGRSSRRARLGTCPGSQRPKSPGVGGVCSFPRPRPPKVHWKNRQRGPRAPCAHTISQDGQSPSSVKHRDREGTHRARARPPRREAAEPTGTQKGSPANRTLGDAGPRVAGAPLGERPRARLTPHPAAVLPRTSTKNPKQTEHCKSERQQRVQRG